MVDHELIRAVTDAVLELCCRDGGLNERLATAAEKLDLYLPWHDPRPGVLLQRANALRDELLAHRDPTPIADCWNNTTAQRLAERVLHLYAELQATVHHDVASGLPPSNHTENLGRGVDQ